MNKFLRASKAAIKRNGEPCTYKKITQGVYDVETSSVSQTEQSYSVLAFREVVSANQYNYPNLVGKEVLKVYLQGDEVFTPSPDDKVVFGSDEFTVKMNQAYRAGPDLCLHILICSRG